MLLLEGPDGFVEADENFSGNLVASELSEQLLLRRQIEILVVDNLVPDTLSVDREAIGGDASVVLGEEDAAVELFVTGALAMSSSEPGSQVLDLGNELVGLENLVRESSKAEIEIVLDAGVFEALGFGYGRPDLRQILDQGVAQS